MAKEVTFQQRSKTEYESTLGPKLIVIAASPLPNDKREIFDCALGSNYLMTLFKSKFKSAETHVTYVKEEGVHFARNVLFNILGRYVWKKTLDTKKLCVAFVGQSGFDTFVEDYNQTADTNAIGLYVNRENATLKFNANWLGKEMVLAPYVILPEVNDGLFQCDIDELNALSPVIAEEDNPYCHTEQLTSKLKFILDVHKEGGLKYITFAAKINHTTNKIEYFRIHDKYTNKEVLYCPTDKICETDPPEQKASLHKMLKEVLCTVPVIGPNIENVAQMFPFRDQIKTLSQKDIEEEVPRDTRFFQVTNLITNQPTTDDGPKSEWYEKWYHQIFLPKVKQKMSKRQLEREAYTHTKHEWIYDIEVFQDDWLIVAKTLDGGLKMVCWNDPAKLRLWMKNKILIGFNNAAYDDRVIKHAMYQDISTYRGGPALTVKEYSDMLIGHAEMSDLYHDVDKNSPIKPYDFLTWDIGFHNPFNITQNSLKKLTMSVLNRRNYDSAVPFDIKRPLTQAEREEVERYCEMDVDNTLALYLPSPEDIEKQKVDPKHRGRTFARESYDIKWNLIVTYGLKAKTLVTKSASFAGKLICGEETKADLRNTFKMVNGKRQYYCIPDLALTELAGTKLLQFYLDNQDNPLYITEKYEEYLGGEDEGHKYQFGFGGLHQALINYRGENLLNSDVTSLYPSLLVEYGLMSRGASLNPDAYKDIYHTRVQAKREKNKLLNEGLKLILNSAIGAMLTKHNALYDTWSNSSVCVHGQLLLYILVKRLFDAGYNIVQTNTDGVMVEKLEGRDPITEIHNQWEIDTRLGLEHDEIKLIQQNNVNNYYCEFVNGDIKSKGFYKGNEKFGKATSVILCNLVTGRPPLQGTKPRDYVIFKKHSIGEIYDGITREKVEGRSLAFVVGNPEDSRTQMYYSRSRNQRKVAKKDNSGKIMKDELGETIMEIINSESKISGFSDSMLLVDDINALAWEEINTQAYISFAKNLLNAKEEFGPYYDEYFMKTEEMTHLQALNQLKDHSDLHPTKAGVVCRNFLFECDYLSKEDQIEMIEKNKDVLYRVVWSGNRSFHCVIRLDTPVSSIAYKKIWYFLKHKYKFTGADEQCALPNKYTRVPDQMNPKTGELQELYSYDQNIISLSTILEEIPTLKDEIKPTKEFTGEITMEALKRHIKRQDWLEGNRFAAVQKLSPNLISLVTEEELYKMIPVPLERDHKNVIRSKYFYFMKKQQELEKEEK